MCLTCGTSKFTRTIRKVVPEGHRNNKDSGGYNSRDKNDINGHIHIHFEDVLGEPDFDTNINSSDCVWINSYTCYSFWKNCVYCAVSTLCALPLAIGFGLVAFCTSFCHIWLLTPCHRCLQLSGFHCLGVLNGLFCSCLIEPTAKACGGIFWAFKKGGGNIKQRGKVTFNKTVKYKTIPPRKSVAT